MLSLMDGAWTWSTRAFLALLQVVKRGKGPAAEPRVNIKQKELALPGHSLTPDAILGALQGPCLFISLQMRIERHRKIKKFPRPHGKGKIWNSDTGKEMVPFTMVPTAFREKTLE